mgnify:CR=1 FL=1
MIKNLAKLAIDNGGLLTPLIIPGELTDGTGLCNVSIYKEADGRLIANVRHVHYSLYHAEFDQKFYCKYGTLSYLNPEDDIKLRTGNYLCNLNPETLEIETYQKIDTSKHDIKPVWTFIGLEDVRILRWNDIFYICGVRRDVKPDGEGRMELCEVHWDENNCKEITRDRIEVDPHTYLEKNWMPVLDMPMHFIRWCDPLQVMKIDPVNGTSKVVIEKEYNLDIPRELRGGSQVIPFGNEGDRICLTHGCLFFHHPGKHKDAQYYHRFVIWDKDWNLKALTKPFKFMDAQIEFACGLVIEDDNFIATFGYQDNAAYALRLPINLLDKLEWEDKNTVWKN